MINRNLLLGLLLLPSLAWGHGGVSVEDDKCIMKIGSMRAHFTGYQPEKRATQEFCEDIPEVGHAIIVVDFISNELRGQSVDFRVMADVNELKATARYEQLGDSAAIESATLVHVPAQKYPRGTVTFEHEFGEPGWYIGMLTTTDEASGESVHSVFPFRVGMKNYWGYLPAFMIVFALCGLAYRATGRKSAPK